MMTRNAAVKVMSGNEAVADGALAAGVRFFAGYPITPSSEIAEELSVMLPRSGGVFIQMEDEIAAMGAVIGASLAGSKSLTATWGPGFSLKQENIGFACMAEVPVRHRERDARRAVDRFADDARPGRCHAGALGDSR